jgi:hypothetical protein
VISRDLPFMRTLRHVPRELLVAALNTAATVEADFPNLPAHDDVEVILPPHGRRWARRVGASSWWVLYTWSITTQTLILRTVNELP